MEDKSMVKSRLMATLQFVGLSFLGVFMFFVNVDFNGKNTIVIQHIIDFVSKTCGPLIPYYTLLMVLGGAIMPIINKSYKRSKFDMAFTAAKVLGGVIGIMAVFNIGPALLMQPDYIPFLFNSIVVPIALMIPISGFAFVALMNYGLVEFVGTFMQKIMRKVWNTPGESAIDALVSFSGGYAMAVLVTNSFYRRGIYTARESVIIATGFSTVSISFLIVVANTLGLMSHWNLYFFSCALVTFAVTAITSRIYPISKIPNEYFDKPAPQAPEEKGNIMTIALKQGIDAAQKSPSYFAHLKEYYLGEAIKMSSAVTASILSIGLIGILIANLTPVFDIIGYIFYPITALLPLDNPMLVAKASAIEIAEMFLPALLVVAEPMLTKFVVAVTSVSAVLFFSASIPSLLSTDIPIKMKDLILIWIERTVLSLIMATAIGMIFF